MGINKCDDCCREFECDVDCNLANFRENDIVEERLNDNDINEYNLPIIDVYGRGQLVDYLSLQVD
jgi:hypothetical protein